MKKIRIGGWVSILMIIGFAVVLLPGHASAHAVLVQAVPPPNSHIEKEPKAIRLTFNERLEKQLYSIRVFDGKGQPVKTPPAVMSEDHHQIWVKLPPLKDGVYTVDYHIISNDTHPVEAAYTLTIGNSPEPGQLGAAVAGTTQDLRHGGLTYWTESLLLYLSMLIFGGMLLWRMLYPSISENGELIYENVLRLFKRAYFFLMFGIGIVRFIYQMDGFGWGKLGSALFDNVLGIAWLLSLAATLITWRFLPASRMAVMLWIIVVLGAESINGHAFGASLKWLAVTMDFIHLLAASIWAGGLVLLLLLRKHPERFKAFLPVFSKAAFISVCVLAVSGSLQAWFIDHHWTFLIHSEWGWLLAGKILLLIGVVFTAWTIRKNWKNGRFKRVQNLIVRDAVFMVLIVALTADLTYAYDQPYNNPLFWNESRGAVHENTVISPDNPGTENSIRVQVTLADHSVPAQVKLIAEPLSYQGISKIDIPLKAMGTDSKTGVTIYSANGNYFSVPGRWKLRLEILDKQLNQNVFEKTIRLYNVHSG